MEIGNSLLAMVSSGQVGRALKVYGSWQWEMYCALARLSGRSARSRADWASVTSGGGGLRGAGHFPRAGRQRRRGEYA